MSRDDILIEITPQVLMKAYACGIFPMAGKRGRSALHWIERKTGACFRGCGACSVALAAHYPIDPAAGAH